jgi:1-acyl-sn-glycerol-3-phosphate acyltransferase
MRHWAQSLLAILNIEQSLTGVMPAEFGVPALLVANHISWLDVVALMSVGATTFVAKSEVRRWPVIGWMAQHTGTTFIQRGRRHDIARVNQALADNLASGACAAIFPEGTTTDGTGLLPFHSGLFEAARGAGAWVWPVAIRYHHADGTITHAADFLGDASLLASLWRIALAPSLRIGLAYAAPLVMRGKHRRELATQARERIAALLQIPVTSHQSRPRIEAVEHAYHGGSELSSQQKIA